MNTNDKSPETIADELATTEISPEEMDEVSGGGKGQLIIKGAKAIGRGARDAAAWIGLESLFD